MYPEWIYLRPLGSERDLLLGVSFYGPQGSFHSRTAPNWRTSQAIEGIRASSFRLRDQRLDRLMGIRRLVSQELRLQKTRLPGYLTQDKSLGSDSHSIQTSLCVQRTIYYGVGTPRPSNEVTIAIAHLIAYVYITAHISRVNTPVTNEEL